MTGTLELLCGPSGVGKTTSSPQIIQSQRVTSRGIRKGERDTRDFDGTFSTHGYFIREEEFEVMGADGTFGGRHRYPNNPQGNLYAFDIPKMKALLDNGVNLSEQIVDCDAVRDLSERLEGYPVKKTLILTDTNDIFFRLLRRYGYGKKLTERFDQLSVDVEQIVENLDLFDDVVVNAYHDANIEQDLKTMTETWKSVVSGLASELFHVDVADPIMKRYVSEMQHLPFTNKRFVPFEDPIIKERMSSYGNHQNWLYNEMILAIGPLLFGEGHAQIREDAQECLNRFGLDHFAKQTTSREDAILRIYNLRRSILPLDELLKLPPVRLAFLYGYSEVYAGKDTYLLKGLFDELGQKLCFTETELLFAEHYADYVSKTQERSFVERVGSTPPSAVSQNPGRSCYQTEELLISLTRVYANFAASLSGFHEDNYSYVTGSFNYISGLRSLLNGETFTVSDNFSQKTREYRYVEDSDDREIADLVFFPLFLWELQENARRLDVVGALNQFNFAIFNPRNELSPTPFIRKIMTGKSPFYNRMLERAYMLETKQGAVDEYVSTMRFIAKEVSGEPQPLDGTKFRWGL